MSKTSTVSNSTHRYTAGRILRGMQSRLRVLTQGVAYLGSRVFYGNFAGFRNNFFPRRDLARFRAVSGMDRSLIEAGHRAAADQLQRDGYCMLTPTRYPPALLQSVIQQYNRLIEDDSSSVRSPNGATRFIYQPRERIPEAQQLLTHELASIVRAYYGCSFRVKSLRAWRNYHVPGVDDRSDVFSNTFHQDGYEVTGLRVFVLLCNGVRRDTGAFRFHDKHISRKIVRSLGFFHRSVMTEGVRRRLADSSTLRFFEGEAGDVCVCNTQECLHGAGIPKAGTFRDVVQFEIVPYAGDMHDRLDAFRDMPRDAEIEEMRRRG